MDPDATLAVMRDETADVEDRIVAASALREWVNKGGFLPRTGYGLTGSTATRLMLVNEIHRVLALTVR